MPRYFDLLQQPLQRQMMQSAAFGTTTPKWNNGTTNLGFHMPAERLETPPPPSSAIPFPRDRDFVDRGDILEIRQRCSEPANLH
ncbi:hypothetical protein B0T25DRAFT_567127 [Lasiosphaeria hispida]|uniref:Uncharacterized protein n=1 Tax=Lasiosphaeria hispida TaxID=260671 RepID=A0AAJ0MGJ4_9PEZI|nr:hypothetical protein B0T25DRAFT_567127 [Lasiosphaeria hispida]